MKSVIVVHGGAGAWDLGSERFQEALAACEKAAEAGQSILAGGGAALDAVEAAVRILEDAPVLDAGRGSYLNSAGEVEMDALIMDGRGLNLGAVGAVQYIQNPISLARRVMEDCPHTFMVGRGAEAFAESLGLPRCRPEDLLIGNELDAYEALREGEAHELAAPAEAAGPLGDTVGAVALDANGDLAAATSTGGTRRKLPGRVGDSPLVGSGGYADNRTGAASATGHGESLMKIVICKQMCDFIAMGLTAQQAGEAAIGLLGERVKGSGGLISVDRHGRIGVAYNTAAMPHAMAAGEEAVKVGH